MLASHLHSFTDMAVVLSDLDRGPELISIVDRAPRQTSWIEAATAFVRGDPAQAAEIYGHNASLPDEAFARLRAAKSLIARGRRAEGDAELQRALGFFRSVDATAYLREGEALLARSA
jgi:hypothetical protein